jgi:flagellar hook-associated protein 3 FlgL
VQAEANSADTALGSAISLIQSAQTLGSEGANTSPNTGTYQTIAQQIQNIQQQLVTIANTTVAGRSIFGGATDQSDPYQYDATNTTTSANKLTAQTPGGVIVNPSGTQVYQGLTAQQIFDDTDSLGNPTANNVFVALQSLNAALTAGSQTGIATALDGLRTAATYLNQQQAYYGASEQRITSEQNSAANEITQLKTQIGNIRDTDVTAAATQLSQEQVDQSAAYGAQAEVSTKTLFDYLG